MKTAIASAIKEICVQSPVCNALLEAMEVYYGGHSLLPYLRPSQAPAFVLLRNSATAPQSTKTHGFRRLCAWVDAFLVKRGPEGLFWESKHTT